MDNHLVKTFKIASFDLDPQGKARLTTLAGFFQEMAYLHASLLGFGFHDLEKNNSFWVLSRIRIRVERYPVWDQEVRVETWHNGVERLFGLREFRVADRSGNEIALATSAWLILDARSRRPVRPDEGLLDARTGRGSLFPGRLDKIDLPGDLVMLGERRVVFSDLDILGHVNNVKYMEWCVDLCMDRANKAGEISGRDGVVYCPVRELEINYTGEARLGDTIEILGSRDSVTEEPGKLAEIFFLARDSDSGREVFRARLKRGI